MRILLILLCLCQPLFSVGHNTDTLTVLFAFGSSKLDAPSKSALKILRLTMNEAVRCNMEVHGYTDYIGSSESNQRLSEARVQSVLSALSGAEGELITETYGHGELPAGSDTSNDEKLRSQARRVDLIYTFTPLPDQTEFLEGSVIQRLLTNAEVGEKITLPNILFKGGTSVILESSYTSARELRDYLLAHPTVEIKILGHICCHENDGTDGTDINTGLQNLSKARADRIEEWLIDQGIDASRLQTEGKMASEPLGRQSAYDRRVEVEVVSN